MDYTQIEARLSSGRPMTNKSLALLERIESRCPRLYVGEFDDDTTISVPLKWWEIKRLRGHISDMREQEAQDEPADVST